MNTNFFCTDFLDTPRNLGHPGNIPGTSQVPSLETQGKQTFEGGCELFDPQTPPLRSWVLVFGFRSLRNARPATRI